MEPSPKIPAAPPVGPLVSRTPSGLGDRLLLATTALALLLPLWTVANPPLVDYPNHLARSYVLAHIGDFAAFVQNYRIDWRPLPYLTVDFVLVGLMQVVSPPTAGRLLLSAIALLYLLGAHQLGRAFTGRAGAPVLLVAFFAYNSTFYYGFLNYNLAMALFLITLAVWVPRRERPTARGILLAGALSLLTYFTHLAGFVVLGVTVAGITASDIWASRRLARRHVAALLGFAPAIVLLALYMTGEGTVGHVAWGTIAEKFVALPTPFITYDRRVDLVALALLAAAGGIAFLGRTCFALRRAPLAAAVPLLAAFVASPYTAMTGSAADVRFVMPFLACAVFAPRMDTRPGARRLALGLVLAASLLKVGGVWAAWAPQSRKIAGQIQLLGAVEEGARVFPLYLRASDAAEDKRERGMIHVVHYATIERRALVPTAFTFRAQQVLELAWVPRQRDTAYGEAADVSIVKWDDLSTTYDYVWSYRLNAPYRARLESIADPIGSSGRGELWRVRRHAPAPDDAGG